MSGILVYKKLWNSIHQFHRQFHYFYKNNQNVDLYAGFSKTTT